MKSIQKLCADHLRAFCDNYGIKLKSGHAHELVAAFLGYKSLAAMHADTLCSIENISKAEILVLTPSVFIDDRRKCLENLPAELPDTYTLGEAMLVFLTTENKLSGRSFASWEDLAEVLTTEHLQKNGDLILPSNFRPYEKARNIFNKPLYEFKPKIEVTNDDVKLTVTNRYYGSQNVNFQAVDVKLAINLKRVAGYIGYKNAEIYLINDFSQSFGQSGVV